MTPAALSTNISTTTPGDSELQDIAVIATESCHSTATLVQGSSELLQILMNSQASESSILQRLSEEMAETRDSIHSALSSMASWVNLEWCCHVFIRVRDLHKE